MNAKESFYGTIALGVAALLILAAGAYWLAAPMAFKATALTAVLSYLTQATTTVQVTIEHQLITGYGTHAGWRAETKRTIRRMYKIAVLLWLLTVVAGTMATMLLIVGR